MSYTPTTWTTGDTITATKLNKMEQGIASGGYDLVLSIPFVNPSVSDIEVIEGDILACEQKIANDEPVNAVLMITGEFSYTPSGKNAPNYNRIAKLTFWHCPYCFMSFSCIHGFGVDTSYSMLYVYNIVYDPDDGSILSFSYPYTTIIS